MTETTARLALPLLMAGQAQKEVFHNEALQRIDACVAACVADVASAVPPSAPSVGDCFIVGPGGTGAWSGHDGAIAAFGAGGWRFVAPRTGLRAFVASVNVEAVFYGGSWRYGLLRGANVTVDGNQVVASRQAAIADPVGGGTIDAQGRTAIAQMLAAMRTHGLIAT